MWLEAGVRAELGLWLRIAAGLGRAQPELKASSQLSLVRAWGAVQGV